MPTNVRRSSRWRQRPRRSTGSAPLDDQVRLELAYGAGPDSHHILVRLAGDPHVIAYAHAVRDSTGVSGHLVVHPEQRRHGVGP